MHESFFRRSLGLISILLGATRLYYGWRANQAGGKVVMRRAGAVRTGLLWIFGGSAALASLLYVVVPARVHRATLPLPTWMRGLGVGLGSLTVLLFGWAHHGLGANWSMPAEIKERQTLIISGPYRWVRHPMYTTIFVWAAAFLLISANWLIGGAWFGLAITAATLIPREETVLIETFGEAYRSYMRRTGRLLPRMRN